MAVLLGQPVSGDGLNKGLCAWYYPIGAPYSGFTSWTDLVTKKQATVTAGVTWQREFGTITPYHYQAAGFTSGSSQYVSCPLPAGLNGAVKASMTVLMRNVGTGNSVLGFATGATDDYWTFSGLAYFGIFRSARVDGISQLGGFDNRDWAHIGITTDGTTWRMYQDGQEIKNTSAEATVTATKLELGRNGNSSYASCSIASARVWVDRSLSQADVMADFIAAKQGYRRQFNYTKQGFIASVAAPSGLAANPLYGGGAAASPLWGYVA